MVGAGVAVFEYLVEGVLLALTAAVGIVGNLAFIVIFSYHRQRISTFHRLVSLKFKLSLLQTLYGNGDIHPAPAKEGEITTW